MPLLLHVRVSNYDRKRITAIDAMSGETKTAAAPAGAEPIFGKKFMSKLGGMANEEAASSVSAFARRQMEKMGWKEGKGLGKEEQGVVTHVRVKKREESMGVRLRVCRL